MRPICWLHISDIHMRPSDAWSQDVVLRAMADDVGQRRREHSPDFVLVSGDLAFSGKREEYALVSPFLDALGAAAGVPRERIFCIPGNHDIDRDRQRLAFAGARTLLQDQNRTDALLAPESREELESLLRRQEAYRHFQTSYLERQERLLTGDGLAYVSRLTIDDVRLAVVGLDSAWLADGGIEDHGKLLIGERQVINALRLAQEGVDAAHIIVAMSHHPLHILQEFDRRPIQSRLERNCQFIHCGHFHEPDAHYSGAVCLTISAGASYDTRHTQNSYSFVTLELLHAKRSVKTVHYDPHVGLFSAVSHQDYAIELQPPRDCTVEDLAAALAKHGIAEWRHYLAALLLDQKAESIVSTPGGGYTFASRALIETLPNDDLKQKTTAFFAFRNVLWVLCPGLSLDEILRRHGESVVQYGRFLSDLAIAQAAVKARLDTQEEDARSLAIVEPRESFWQTSAMLKELARSREWTLLREQAARHADSTDRSIALLAKRMLALALANSTDQTDKDRAIEHYTALTADASAEPSDFSALALLFVECGDFGKAREVVLSGIERCAPSAADYLMDVGQEIVAATGDREFRKQLEAAVKRRASCERR